MQQDQQSGVEASEGNSGQQHLLHGMARRTYFRSGGRSKTPHRPGNGSSMRLPVQTDDNALALALADCHDKATESLEKKFATS